MEEKNSLQDEELDPVSGGTDNPADDPHTLDRVLLYILERVYRPDDCNSVQQGICPRNENHSFTYFPRPWDFWVCETCKRRYKL